VFAKFDICAPKLAAKLFVPEIGAVRPRPENAVGPETLPMAGSMAGIMDLMQSDRHIQSSAVG